MTEQQFREFLSRRTVSYLYKDAGLEGLINVCPSQGKFVLTWEECKAGDQYNEQNYTRDEVQHFFDLDAVITHLRNCGIDVTQFEL